MGEKDIVSKEAVRHLAIDLAVNLLGLEIDADSLELVESEHRRIEDRRADLVARLREKSGSPLVLHIEIQNNNDGEMPLRMLRYRLDLEFAHRNETVRQYLIYIGGEPLRMPAGLERENLSYRYEMIDMRQVDCEQFITRDDPDGLVLAILCDFHGREPQAVVNHIFLRLHQLLGDNPKRLREYIDMLEILSDNRDLKSEIKEAENMLSQVKVERLPSYELGMERGIEQGLEQGLEQGKVLGAGEGQARMLLKQLRARFGELPDEIVVMVQAADTEQLELWGERVLSAGTLGEVFAER